ncbi:MAG: HAD hydrolase family protein [Acholeplasmatales bacterium]|nr:HAD hydrolase family protein [Acholeplasmatales bacterium]
MVKRRIGMRTLKTAVAIGICMLLYILFKTLDSNIIYGGQTLYKRKTGFRFSDFYSPFFAGIAAAYSLYPSKRQSIAQAKNRVVASLLGGLAGMILTISYGLIGKISGNDFFTWPNLGDNFKVTQYIVPYILITIFVVIVIVVGNALGKKGAIFVGILTLISVTINPMGMIVNRYNESVDFLGEAVFGFNRILSTVFGVFIALFVNFMAIPHKHKNNDLLFMIGVEGMLDDEYDEIKGYMNYKLNRVCDDGINVSLFTTRVPSTFMYLLDTVHINHPVVCMSGAALYDTRTNKYLYLETMPKDAAKELDKIFEEHNLHPFKNYVVDDLLNIYIEEFDNEGMRAFYEEKKNAMYSNMILGKNKNNDVLLHYMICVEKERVESIVDTLEKSSVADKILIQVYDAFMNLSINKDLKFIKIYSKEISKLNVLRQYTEANDLRIVGLTTSNMADHLLLNSDIRISSVKSNIENTKVVDTYDDLFRNITKIYYGKDYER